MLAALYFVPSATASPAHEAPAKAPSSATSSAASADRASARLGDLADTGAVDTKPYLVGGGIFLAVGAGLVLGAGRRARAEAEAEPLESLA